MMEYAARVLILHHVVATNLRRAFLIACREWACNVSQKINKLDLIYDIIS